MIKVEMDIRRITVLIATVFSLVITPVVSMADTGLTLVGSFAYSGAGGGDMAVNTYSDIVFIAGGMGQQGLIRVNASNPASMSQGTLSYGGGIAVDKSTGRYATTNGGGTLYVFNQDDTLYDSQAISGCGGSLDADPATGRFFISTQCDDHIAVYSESSKSLLANAACGGVGSRVVFDSGTGNIFENETPNYGKGGVTAPLVVSSSGYGTSLPLTGFVYAADGTLKRLYANDNSGNLLVLDSTTYATLHRFTGVNVGAMVADTALSRFYTVYGSTITAYDAITYAQLGTLTLPGSIQNMCMSPGDNRLYAIDGSKLYVLQTGASSCSYTLGSSVQSFTSSAGTGSVSVSPSVSSCSWTAASNVSWITITSGSSGTGNGTVGYSVSANTGASSRTGTISIGGQTFTITQAGPTYYSISGTISASNGTAISGVTVTLSGTSTASATTGSSGSYSFTGLSTGSYTIIPGMTGYTFSPSVTTVSISSANLTGENFTGTASAACTNSPVSLAGAAPVYFTSIQSAYYGASNSNIIETEAGNFTEILNFDQNVAINLLGGYDCNYLNSSSFSTINGSLTISNGTVKVSNLIIQSSSGGSDQSAEFAQEMVDLSNQIIARQISDSDDLTQFKDILQSIDNSPNGPQLYQSYLYNVVLGTGFTHAAAIEPHSDELQGRPEVRHARNIMASISSTLQNTINYIENSQAYLVIKTFIETVIGQLSTTGIPEPAATGLSAAKPEIVSAILTVDYKKEIDDICLVQTALFDICEDARQKFSNGDPAGALVEVFNAAGKPLPSYMTPTTTSTTTSSSTTTSTSSVTTTSTISTTTSVTTTSTSTSSSTTTSIPVSNGVSGSWAGTLTQPGAPYTGCDAQTVSFSLTLYEDSQENISGSTSNGRTIASGVRIGDSVVVTLSTMFGLRGPYTWDWDGANTITGSMAYFCYSLDTGDLLSEGAETFTVKR